MNSWIPRNLSEEDYIKFSSFIEVRTNELPIYCGVTILCIKLYNVIPTLIKPEMSNLVDPIRFGVVITTMVITYICTKINILGQPLPEFFVNYLFYIIRSIMYKIRSLINVKG